MRISGLGRFALGSLVAAALLSACGGSQPVAPALNGSSTATSGHDETFQYTGSKQEFVVPSGVTEIKVKAFGAAGQAESEGPGSSGGSDFPGFGSRINAVVRVTPGETLVIFVGGQPNRYSQAGGFNGGGGGGTSKGYCNSNGFGGGGATDVRQGGDALPNRIVVAGGGGGAGNTCPNYGSGFGGGGGGLTGEHGGGTYSKFSGEGGLGGSQYRGGQGGSGGSGGQRVNAGKRGRLGIGGAGGQGSLNPAGSGAGGGGGGGGYYGGGGGGGGVAASASYGGGGGGGGGSSYAESSARNVQMWLNSKKATRNGLVVLRWK
jgi:hypothetical protein